MTADLTTPPLCRNCQEPRKPRANQPGYRGANGYCEACNNRWHAVGCPPEGPPPPLSPSEKTAKGNNTRRAAKKEPVTVKRFPAACAGESLDLFYPPEGGDGSLEAREAREAAAKAVCAGCAGRRDCLEEALARHDWHGIHGGLTEVEKQHEHRRRVRVVREAAA